MNDTTTSGWTNKQTWAMNLRCEGLFECMAEEQEWGDVDHLADCMEATVCELEFDHLKEGTLAHEAVGDFLDKVNWVELAEHYFAGHVSEEDSERLQAMADRLTS